MHTVYIAYTHQPMPDALLFLSSTDSTPMYQQIIDQITCRVMAGDWAGGDALPSIRELASANQVSVITVKRAYLELERAGIILTRQGKGSFVTEAEALPTTLMRKDLDRQIEALIGCAQRLGLSASELLRELEQRLADATDMTTKEPPGGTRS